MANALAEKRFIASLVPIYHASGLDLLTSIQAAFQDLQVAKNRFEVAASSLRASTSVDSPDYIHVDEWNEGCRRYYVSNLNWR